MSATPSPSLSAKTTRCIRTTRSTATTASYPRTGARPTWGPLDKPAPVPAHGQQHDHATRGRSGRLRRTIRAMGLASRVGEEFLTGDTRHTGLAPGPLHQASGCVQPIRGHRRVATLPTSVAQSYHALRHVNQADGERGCAPIIERGSFGGVSLLWMQADGVPPQELSDSLSSRWACFVVKPFLARTGSPLRRAPACPGPVTAHPTDHLSPGRNPYV
jgi:hypothetical protein